MAKLDELLKIDGVVFSRLTPMQWLPSQGWAYTGGDMTVAVGGRVGVFIKTEKADFNKLFQVLVGA